MSKREQVLNKIRMNKNTFQKLHADKLKSVLESPFGRDLMAALGALRPPYEFPQQEHLLIEGRGCMRGYEMCIRNLVSLATPAIESSDLEADYGVPEPKTNQDK